MEIIKNFGLNPSLFGAQIINFLIIFYLLKRFLYKPILDLLKNRQDMVKNGIKQADDARITLEKALETEKQILKKAQDTAQKTIDNAKEQATVISKQIEESARKQSEQILIDAKEQIDQQTLETEKRLTAKISELSIDFLSKSLKEMFSEKTQKEAMDIALKKVRQN